GGDRVEHELVAGGDLVEPGERDAGVRGEVDEVPGAHEAGQPGEARQTLARAARRDVAAVRPEPDDRGEIAEYERPDRDEADAGRGRTRWWFAGRARFVQGTSLVLERAVSSLRRL